MKKIIIFLLSVVAVPVISLGQDTLVNPSPYLLYSSCLYPDSVANITRNLQNPFMYAIENYGEGRHTIYGIAVTAKFPIPDKSKLTYYERHNDTVTLVDSIEGSTVPYPIDYHIKHYNSHWCWVFDTCEPKLDTLPCFLYLFDTPHKNVDTFYVGLKAPRSTWEDTNQISLFGTVMAGTPDSIPFFPNSIGQTWMIINDDDDALSALLPLYYRFKNVGSGQLYPLIGLPCTAPQAPSVSAEGDSLRMEWDNVGEFYQLNFRNTDTDSTVLVSDTLADNHHTLSDRLFEAGNYEVRLRKACRYTTATYNTLVWSEWSNPTAFAVSAHAGITPLTPSQTLSFSLLPNPARGSVTIVMDEPSGSGNGERQLTLLDLQGREIATISHLSGNTFSLDLGPLAPGTYLIRLTTPDATAHQRLVVQ